VSIADLCIRRPVLTLMLTLSLVVFGVLGYVRLGVDQFPRMEFPVIQVSALMEGASPEVMEEDVTDPLEEFLNTIQGVREVTSVTTEGVTQITVTFELDKNLDVAAQDVRDKVALARHELPPEVEPPLVQKFAVGDFPILWIPLISDRSVVDNTEFLKNRVKPRLETIEGVGAAPLFGALERNIRIWLDGDALSARGLAASDVIAALRREHVDIPGGRVESREIEYSVKTDSEFRTLEELGGLVLAERDGAPVHLRDVARIEDGAEDEKIIARYNGEPAIAIGILKQRGGNSVAIADETYARLERMTPEMPAGLSFGDRKSAIDFTRAIREAVDETLFALYFGAVLAVLTVFVFLRRTRPTLIIATAIPLSIVATFGVMWLLDFTLNVMTLLGLTLAVGVVVDDAIVVLENIERHRELGEAPFDAASKGTREIAFAATAATFSIAAVFLPVTFAEGILGNFLREFGVTVAASVIISLFVALTLTPMLASRMPPPKERAHGSIYDYLERAFTWLERSYGRLLDWALGHRGLVLGTALASFVAAIGFAIALDKEFFPPEDRGYFFARLETPPGTHRDATLELMKRNEAWLLQQPEVEGLFAAVGIAGPDSPEGASNIGIMFMILKPRNERDRSVADLIRDGREALNEIPGQRVNLFQMSLASSSRGATLEFMVQGNLGLHELDGLADQMIRELRKRPGYVDLDKSLKLGLPEVRVIPDREKAAALGVDAATMAQAIQAMIGGLDIATFKEGGRGYDVRVRLEREHRSEPEAIQRLYVRSKTGELVELRNLVRIEKRAAPSAITRADRQRSVTVSSNLEGKAIAQAVAEVQEISRAVLPEGARLGFAGEAEQLQESARQMGLILGLSVLVIYMTLAMQFESLLHPLTIMLALPLAMTGALGGLIAMDVFGRGGMSLNMFSMIGIILLFGLVTKNSILLVDYANHLREQGMEAEAAMRAAAPVRMRPVLMTAISMIFGVMPAAIGVGPGAESRAPMGVATGVGMLSSTALTLLVVPVFYLALEDFVAWFRVAPRRLRRALRRGVGRARHGRGLAGGDSPVASPRVDR
jgi:HAE1 family hydrophobic/amphiphilic exporter-1